MNAGQGAQRFELIADDRFGGWRADVAGDSVYTCEHGELVQRPMFRGGGFEDGPDDGGAVAWECISEADVQRLRPLEAALRAVLAL